MNKMIKKVALALALCALVCGTATAAPKGGAPKGGRPTVQKVEKAKPAARKAAPAPAQKKAAPKHDVAHHHNPPPQHHETHRKPHHHHERHHDHEATLHTEDWCVIGGAVLGGAIIGLIAAAS